MSKIRKVILVIICILVIVFCYFYIGYRMIKVDGQNAVEFENRIIPAIKAGDSIDLRDMTSFQWDEFYYFHAYTPPKQMYEQTGARWTNNNTFAGYLLFNDFEKEILNDGFYALVFLYKSKVVCHYTGAEDKFAFDIETQEGVKAEDAVFRIDYKEVSDNTKYPLLKIIKSLDRE